MAADQDMSPEERAAMDEATRRGLRSLAEGRVVPGEQVEAWLRDWSVGNRKMPPPLDNRKIKVADGSKS